MNEHVSRETEMKAFFFAVSVLVAFACGFPGQSHGQPNIGDALRQVPEQPPVTRPLPNVEIKSIVITGNRELTNEQLLAQIPDALNKRYTFAELQKLVSELTRYYRAQGYFVARVYIPSQEIKDGSLTLRVLEGRYGAFIVENKSLVDDATVQGVLDDVKKYDVISVDTIERAMLILNDTPGIRVTRADVLPGKAIGTSDVAIGTVATSERQGYLIADNFGSRYTGRDRLSFGYDWNSPSGRGDRLSLSGIGSSNRDLLNGRVAYSTLLSPDGWRGEAAATKTTYSLGDTYRALDATGVAVGYDLAITYPIVRTTAQTIEFGLNYSQRDLNDQVRSASIETKKSSRTVSAGLSVRYENDWFGVDGATRGLIRISRGTLDIYDVRALNLDQATGGANTLGDFTKIHASLSRSAILPREFVLTAQARKQFSLNGKNLDGSERMGISGASGVSAYPSGESSGTDALLYRLELSQGLPAIFNIQHRWHLFRNWGSARTLKTSDPRSLSDIGLGWSAQSSNGLIFKIEAAHRTSGQAQSEPDQVTRVLMQAGWIF